MAVKTIKSIVPYGKSAKERDILCPFCHQNMVHELIVCCLSKDCKYQFACMGGEEFNFAWFDGDKEPSFFCLYFQDSR